MSKVKKEYSASHVLFALLHQHAKNIHPDQSKQSNWFTTQWQIFERLLAQRKTTCCLNIPSLQIIKIMWCLSILCCRILLSLPSQSKELSKTCVKMIDRRLFTLLRSFSRVFYTWPSITYLWEITEKIFFPNSNNGALVGLIELQMMHDKKFNRSADKNCTYLSPKI